jgi:ketosteroid isomerase-like protein
MSQENVEVARRLYSLEIDVARAVRGDYDDLFPTYFNPDFEFVPPSTWPDAAPSYRGLEGFRRWYRLMNESWVDLRVEPERFFDAGDQVVVFVRASGRARHSGAALAISAAHVLTVRDRRLTRIDIRLDRAEALEAVGLRE